ncbi:tRNA lysidine(34) synthetase TilS [Caldimonas sp. KR1-144]|uniref:tRNA lysidine(34) synthetase TilS n=1 Tax=Caldimonas sp. KR1-144 TaxID=3400911 RepID=UPI003C0FD6BA
MATPAVAVAYSGGRDSTALLHATLLAARELGTVVHALHVHHGLQARSDDWAAACEAQCVRWARRGLPVVFHLERLALKPRRGESIEALAREARYAALERMARGAGCRLVLLAQHRRDQAETFLLQALRGAGVAGLAGMPHSFERSGITWVRPWLDRPREAVEAYVRRHRLRFIDDDSNADARFARNRLRLKVWPHLLDAFPDAESTLFDAARWAGHAAALADDVARVDLAACMVGSGELDVAAWSALTPARGRNALRAWLRERTGRAPTAALVEQLCRQLPDARGTASWTVDAAMRVERYRGRLRVVAPRAVVGERESRLSVVRAGRHALPGWGGTLVATRVREGGLPRASLVDLELRERVGGERFQLGPHRPARSLKKQFQSVGVAASERDAPLVFSADGRLLFVPGLGADARALAAPGEPQFALMWIAGDRADS